MAGRDQGRISLVGRALGGRLVQLGSATMGLPAQKPKAVGSRAAALPLDLTTHQGNERPHGGKGINMGWGWGEVHTIKSLSCWKKLYKCQQAKA